MITHGIILRFLFTVISTSSLREPSVLAVALPNRSEVRFSYHYTPDRRQLEEDETIVIFFHGTIVNDLRQPVSGSQVQFWHTDKHGVYNHPQDLASRKNASLQPDFQYFGTSTSDVQGKFDFITYRPGIYESRPITHIHYKVWLEGQEVLTSQFYFADEGHTEFAASMQLELEPFTSKANDKIADAYSRTWDQANKTSNSTNIRYFSTRKTIVVNLNLGGTRGNTPSQTEGPFYPVVDFFDAGNDLTRPEVSSNVDASSSKRQRGSD